MPAPSFSRTTAIQALRTNDNIEQLKGNLKEEHILKVWLELPKSPRIQPLKNESTFLGFGASSPEALKPNP